MSLDSMLLTAHNTDLMPAEFLASASEIFALFDAVTQDSGNISYGVRDGVDRFFVKTAGIPDDPVPLLSHDERVALLRNAVRIAGVTSHYAVPALRNVIESPVGPLLVYDWAEGELVGTARARRSDPTSSFARFRGLPVERIVAALDTVLNLHVVLADDGWIAVDFYDGCLIYDFAAHAMRVVDLDNYRSEPFINAMGRMFGSTRFMAPEEFQLGARIDQRTTVFTMGRTILQFLSSDGTEFGTFRGPDALLQVSLRACRSEPCERFATMAEFYRAWRTSLQFPVFPLSHAHPPS